MILVLQSVAHLSERAHPIGRGRFGQIAFARVSADNAARRSASDTLARVDRIVASSYACWAAVKPV